SKVFDHPYTTMPSADRKDLGVFYPFVGHACHVPVVEVDIETGVVTFLHYTAVHDCGTLVNPRSLAGHIVGGTAQGIGTALYEEYVYDDDGQLLSSSYLDYLIPSAMEVPELTIGHVETPSPYTPHGVKGGGTAVPVACDVRDEASVTALAARAEKIGPVHAVVANAGVAGPTAPLHEITLEDWRETLATDLDGVFLTFRAFIPAMIQRRA